MKRFVEFCKLQFVCLIGGASPPGEDAFVAYFCREYNRYQAPLHPRTISVES
nr:MAG TPA: hypothetical protein [Caudoviricetes sp.]